MNRRYLLLLIVALALLVCAFSHEPQRPPFVFAVVGDLQQPDDSAEYRPVTKRIMQEIAAGEAEFLVIVGDLVEDHGQTAELAKKRWQAFDRVIQPLRNAGKKIYAVPGNNDFSHEESQAQYQQRFPSTPNFFIEQGVVFLLLNSEQEGTGYRDWGLGSQQTAWLRNMPWISQVDDAKPLVLAFLHRPVFRSEIMKMDPQGHYGRNKPDVARLLDEAGIAAVFSGHEHLYDRRHVRGMDFFITGGGGANLLPTGFHHYLLVKINPKKKEYRITVKRVSPTG